MLTSYRDDLDAATQHEWFPTPLDFVRSHIALYDVNPRRVLDVGIGTGIYGHGLREAFPNAWIVGIEIRDTREEDWYSFGMRPYNHVIHADAITWSKTRASLPFDLIIGNPPFSLMVKLIKTLYPFIASGGVLSLLNKQSFLSSGERYPFHNAYPPHQVHICANRISFSGDGNTNTYEYAVYDYRPNKSPQPLHFWDWKGNNQSQDIQNILI